MGYARLFAPMAAAWLAWSSVARGQEQEVRVRAAPRAPRDAVTATVSAEEARHVAGTQGDVAKVVDSLPGVARPPLGSGQLVVWGSAPADTRVYIDGVEVPSLYHGSGLRSVINSDLVASVALLPGGFGAEYGRTLGGTVRVETRALRTEGVHGYAGADTFDASGFVSAALGPKARAAVAARYSYLEALLSATSTRDIGDYFPIPRYRDYQARIAFDLARDESLDVTLLGSHDALDRTVASPDPGKTRTERTEGGFHRLYARWKRTTREAEGIEVTPFVGYDRSSLATSFGGNPTKLEVDSFRYGVRASYRVRFGRALVASTGIDASGTASQIVRRGSLTLPSREGDIAVFGAPPSDDTTADDFSTHVLNVAPHLALDVKLGDWTITPGVRAETFLIEGDRLLPTFGQKPDVGFSRVETAIDPRILVRYQPMPRLTFFASGGAYHQAPEPADLSAVFGTPALGLSRALHASLGERITLTTGLTAEVTGFYKSMSDLVVRSRSVTPKLAQSLVQDGEGRSYGLQFLVRRELGHGLSGWIAYTMSRSERRIADVGARYRLFDFDQPHVLVMALSQELGRWVFGARFRYASGMPRTPVVAAYYDSVGDRSDPVFGLQNGMRLPAFYQLDARVERGFPLGNEVLLALSLDVQNVTYHQNSEEVVYSPDFRQRGYIRGLPTLAVLGARLEF